MDYFYPIQDDIKIMKDYLTPEKPYFATTPRNHESIFFVTKGNLIYTKNGASEIVRKDHIGYVSKGSIDESRAFECERVEYYVFNFSFGDEMKNLPFPTSCVFDKSYLPLFKKAYDCFSFKSTGYKNLLAGYLSEIIGKLYSDIFVTKRHKTALEKIEIAVKFLSESYNDPNLKTSDLAPLCNMSEKQFRRVFLEAFGKTPYSFLQEFRINQAELLLESTSKSIGEIAEDCGFSDIYSFSHCFKKHNGVSPTNFRK